MKKILFLVSVAALLVFSGCVSDTPQNSTGLATVPAQGSGTATAQASESISIPLDSLSGQAKWFEYDASGTTVRFFAIKLNDGSVKTAFDACDVCGYAKKGYRQEGSFMVCNNCGNRYPISGIGTENKTPGGCWPGYLPSKIVDGSVVIEKADLKDGVARFN